MAKSKYRFNPESLNYVQVQISSTKKILRIVGIATFILGGAVVFSLLVNMFVDTPRIKGYKRQISELKANYKMIENELVTVDKLLTDLQQRDDNIYRTIFETEPVHSSIREAGFGGSKQYRNLEDIPNAEIVIGVKQRLDQVKKKMYVQSVSYDEIIDMARDKEKMLASIPAIQPISNKDLTRTASGWGYRIHPIYKIRKFHYGIDFTAPTGTEIYSTGDGVIEVVESSRRGYGNKIIVNHGFGYRTLYAHLSGFDVKVGQKVKRGDVIGFVGSTGLSTAPHLHYEVSINNKKVNPINYFFNDLTPQEYEKMIQISINSGQSFD